jgi:PAS domain S-box-containing protein
MTAVEGWSGLFASAFAQSRNAMLLVDGDRRIVDANGAFLALLGRTRRDYVDRRLWDFVVGGPLLTAPQWRRLLAESRFAGEAQLVHDDGHAVAVQWGGATEVVTGRRLVLFVALSTSRAGNRFRRAPAAVDGQAPLSEREQEIIQMVARGDSGPEIAAQLDIAHNTVRTHIRNAMVKLDARSRAHLVAKTLVAQHP